MRLCSALSTAAGRKTGPPGALGQNPRAVKASRSAFEEGLLTRHLDGILAYCHEKVPFGKVEAINGNIRAMLRRGRGYRDHEYLLLKVQRATATRHSSVQITYPG